METMDTSTGKRERKKIQKFKMQIQNLELLFTTLFKFTALFKIRGTIQIQNMNSARALTREWIRHPNLLLFKALLCLYGGWSTR